MNILNVDILQIVDIQMKNIGLIIKILKNSLFSLVGIITKPARPVTN